MSAYIVSKKHIDALVTFAANKRITWYTRNETKPGHFERHECDFQNVDEVGAMLVAENVRSVSYRYSNSQLDSLPGPVSNEWMTPYTFARFRRPLAAVEVLKAISCYEYQTCEHPEWAEDGNVVREFCNALRKWAIDDLPGYDDAHWEITDETPPTPVTREALPSVWTR